MIDLPFRQHKLTFLILGICLLVGLFWGIRLLSLQFLLINSQRLGEDKLLNYVTDLRRELTDYRFLPYTLTDNPDVRYFLDQPNLSNESSPASLQRQLEDMTKVSKTLGWFIFNKDGDILLSSEQNESDGLSNYFSPTHIQQELLKQQGESILLSNYNRTDDKVSHLVLAPVYSQNRISGAIGVRIGLTDLVDSWTIAGDLMAITDQSKHIFLANGLNDIVTPNLDMDAINSRLLDGTRIERYQQGKSEYLIQHVVLDDLLWQLHYLSPIESLYKNANLIASAGISLVAFLLTFALYRRERSLKIASEIENQRLVNQNTLLQRALIENTHVGLIQLTESGCISFVNPTGYRYFGYLQTIIGHDIRQLLPDVAINDATLLALSQLFAQQRLQKIIDHEVMICRPDKSVFPALFSVSPIEWSQSHGYLVTIIDISKRKQAELQLTLINQQLEARVIERTQALEETQKELLRSEKLAAIGQMSTAIAHELNQPLTGIRTLAYSAELLLQRNKIEEAQATLADLESLVSRMQSLTSELKVLAYRRPEQLQRTNCQICCQSAIQSLGEKIEKAQIHLENDALWVMAEPIRLERIFANLILNAIEACEPTANLVDIYIHSQQQGQRVIITVSDNGPGVDDQQLAHLLEPFYTSKPIGKGLGLGLAISANLANDMQGTLSVSPNRPTGLKFTLSLLVADAL